MQSRYRTRALVATTGLVLALAACGGGGDKSSSGATASSSASGGSVEQPTVKIMMFPGQSYRVPVAVAEQEGYLKDAGITLTKVDQPNNLQGMQALQATGADIGVISTPTLVQGVQAGSDGAFFCGGINVLQTTLMAPPDSKLPATKDGHDWKKVLQALEGKNVGIQTPVGSGLQLIFAEALSEAGVKNVNYVNIGAGFTVLQGALQSGSVDVVQANPPGTQSLIAAKAAKPLIYMADGPSAYADYYGSAFVAPKKFIQGSPKTARAFCDAITKAEKFIGDSANADAVTKVIAAETGVTPDVAKDVIPTFKDFSTKLDPDRLQTTFDAYVKLGLAKPEPKPTVETLVMEPKG
jgi:ABC-type nitrate/sulfonate/bicarbonate transport system substrate-binding protein